MPETIKKQRVVSYLNGKFRTEYASVQVENIPAGGSDYNVQESWEVPAGYEVTSVSIYASSGCIAGNSGLPSSSGLLTASVYNPTNVTRSPYITWIITMIKTDSQL